MTFFVRESYYKGVRKVSLSKVCEAKCGYCGVTKNLSIDHSCNSENGMSFDNSNINSVECEYCYKHHGTRKCKYIGVCNETSQRQPNLHGRVSELYCA